MAAARPARPDDAVAISLFPLRRRARDRAEDLACRECGATARGSITQTEARAGLIALADKAVG